MVRFAPFLAGLAIASGVGAGTFGLAQTLLKPHAQLKVAARAIGELGSGDYVTSKLRLGSGFFRVRCQPLTHSASLVILSDGRRVLVTRKRISLFGTALFGTSKAWAIADLAGCPLVLGRLLTTRVQTAFSKGQTVLMARHGPDYWIRLTRRRPLVFLVVNRGTLEPVGVLLRSRVLNGGASIQEIRRPKGLAS